MDNESLTVTEYRTCQGVINGVLIVIVMALIAIAAFAATRVNANDQSAGADSLCSYFAELSTQRGVAVANWIGYPEGWEDYPQGWDYETYTDLANGTGILTKAIGNTRWLWGFRSLTENDGNHDFCEHVLIVDDSP